MLKFVLGVVFGAGLAVGYVRYNVELPEYLQLTDKLRGNLVSTATEFELYDLDKDIATRRRALEILFANRADFAVEVDAEFGHPFMKSLYRRQAIRDARILRGQWRAFDTALAQPALRERFEQRYGTEETEVLKQRMLAAALQKDYPFLKSWLDKKGELSSEAELFDTLKRVGVLTDPGQPF